MDAAAIAERQETDVNLWILVGAVTGIIIINNKDILIRNVGSSDLVGVNENQGIGNGHNLDARCAECDLQLRRKHQS